MQRTRKARHPTAQVANEDPGWDVRLPENRPEAKEEVEAPAEKLWAWNSPGLWAIVSIGIIGAFNLMGPKHTAGFAMFAAAGMIVITLLVVVFALPQVDWRHLNLGTWRQDPLDMWRAFVFVVLALSGVEAISNLTGVMKKPVYATARKSIWVVASEVAVFNLVLALMMVAMALWMARMWF